MGQEAGSGGGNKSCQSSSKVGEPAHHEGGSSPMITEEGEQWGSQTKV